MAPRIKKDKDLKQYELMQYFAEIARQADPSIVGDMILHNIAGGCPTIYMEDIDAWICGRLVGLLENCIEALQSVPKDRATPMMVECALSVVGQHLVDINDPKLRELGALIDGKQNKR